MRQYNTVLTNSAEYGIINQRDFFDHDIANSSNIQGYYVISPNDYVYNPRISTIAPVGPINRNKLGYFGVMSPLYYAFRINKDSVCLDYLDFFFKSCMWHGFMYKNGNSGARSDRFSINDSVFVKMPIPCPNSTKEQKMIGAYFEKVENVVASTSSKLTKMRTMKQSLLQKMFA